MDSYIYLTEDGNLVVGGLRGMQNVYLYESPFLTYVDFPDMQEVFQFQITENPVLTNVSAPALKSYVGASGFTLMISRNPLLATINLNALISSSTSMAFTDNNVMTALQLGALVFCYMGFSVYSNPALQTLHLPSLVTVAQYSPFIGFEAFNCPALTNVSFPKYLPTSGRKQKFTNCALSEASVDHILARCVASAGYISGTVDLSGGTNATPGTQGQIDKAALMARGVTVITN